MTSRASSLPPAGAIWPILYRNPERGELCPNIIRFLEIFSSPRFISFGNLPLDLFIGQRLLTYLYYIIFHGDSITHVPHVSYPKLPIPERQVKETQHLTK
jgi:hypothetical protein